jgi:hypothetical protein
MATGTGQFERKIKTAEEVRRIIGARPRRDTTPTGPIVAVRRRR